MELNFESEKPIYVQLAEQIETAILSGAYPEETQIPSTTEVSVVYKINPATALKGFNLLVDEQIIYKKRGVGMFVSSGAVKSIKSKRKSGFLDGFVHGLVEEAQKLEISKQEIILMIEREFEK